MRCAKFGVVAISLNLVPWPGRTAGNIDAKVAELANRAETLKDGELGMHEP